MTVFARLLLWALDTFASLRMLSSTSSIIVAVGCLRHLLFFCCLGLVVNSIVAGALFLFLSGALQYLDPSGIFSSSSENLTNRKRDLIIFSKY
jgi:hypothetical protein